MANKNKNQKEVNEKSKKLKSKDIESLVVEISNKGKTSAEVGSILREQYGIKDIKKETGKSVSQIRAENGVKTELPEDLSALIKRASKIKEHLSTHKKDLEAKYGLQLIESRARRLAKYYKRTGKIPTNWRYK